MILIAGQKLLRMVWVMMIVTFITFLMMNMLPQDAIYSLAGQYTSQGDIETLQQQFGLDTPIPLRYFQWLSNVTHGDLGNSILLQQPVLKTILSRLPVTLELIFFSVAISLLLSVPFGVATAYWKQTVFDKILNSIAFCFMSVPVFVLGIILIYIFAVHLDWLPASGFSPISEGLLNNIRSLILPAFSIAMIEWVPLMRVLRSDMINTLQQDYILLARAKGLPTSYILLRHSLRSSLFTFITILGMQVGHLIGGAMIVETVFGLPGVGRLFVSSIFAKDYFVVQGCVLVTAFSYVLINFIVDLSYVMLDPRINPKGKLK